MFSVKDSIVVMGIRGLTLVSKFMMLIALTRYFPPEQVGLYGLMLGAVGISFTAFGFEFHNMVGRLIVSAEKPDQATMLRNQAVFHLFSYALLTPVVLLFFLLDYLPWQFVGWFYLLVVLEHVGMEMYRLVVLFQRPVLATLSLFVRTGLWVYVIAFLLLMEAGQYDLSDLWMAWAIAAAISIVMLLPPFLQLPRPAKGIDWGWIKQGFRISLYYLAAGICFRLTQYLDLFFLKSFTDLTQVGIYTFYMGLYRAGQAVIQSGTSVLLQPHIIRAFNAGDMVAYHGLQRKLGWSIFGTSLLMAAIIAVGVYPLFWIIDRPVYEEAVHLLWWLLPALFFGSLIVVPANELYVRHRDKEHFISEAVSTLLIIALCAVFIPLYGLDGAAMAALVAAIGSLAIKWWFARRYSTQ